MNEECESEKTDELQEEQGPITPEAAMRKALRIVIEKERQREKNARLYTDKGQFFASMVRLDHLQSGDCLRGGTTLGSVIADRKEETHVATDKRKLDNACRHLQDIGKGYLVPVLRLINKNRNNIEESIWELMKDDLKKQDTATSTIGKNSANTGASKSEKGRKKRGKKKN